MQRAISGGSSTNLSIAAAALLLAACSMQPHEVGELSDTVLCDIVAHRDTPRDVRMAAKEELEDRDAQCDRLAAVIRRQQMNGLRDQLDPENPEENPPTYTDCVLDPLCKETQ